MLQNATKIMQKAPGEAPEQNLVNVYEYLGMELQVDKYLEDVSHLLYKCTCKKTLNLCVCFC